MRKDESNIGSMKDQTYLKSEADYFENGEINIDEMILCSTEYELR
jgi:hypothetical protein